MSRIIMPRYTVIRDSREKDNYGWSFYKHTYAKRRPPNCDGMIVTKLDTGDYSLVGYEDILSVERKEDYTEIWGNYETRERFEDEMKRMTKIKHKMIIVESHLTPELFELTPPQYRTSVPGKALIRWLTNLTVKYNIPIIPAGQCGQRLAQMFFEEVVRTERDRWVTSNGQS